MTTSIDFSAQFGGPDAAAAVLPHFRALKRAAHGASVPNFPLPELAFILRVDGDVHTFGFRGAANIDIDRKGRYVSIDIGIPCEDRAALTRNSPENVIVGAIAASVSILGEHQGALLSGIDADALRLSLRGLCDRYLEYIAEL